MLVKNAEDEVVKRVPIRVTTAGHLTVTLKEDADNVRMILGNEYEISVNIFNKDGRKIHPSEVRQEETLSSSLQSVDCEYR